jgi:phosphate transport system permease protein
VVRNTLGALLTSVSVTLLLFGRLAPFTGLIGWVIVAYAIFLATYAFLTAQADSGPAVVDAVVSAFLWSTSALVVATLADVVGFTLARGLPALPHLNFYTKDLSRTGQAAPLTSGGVSHAIVGTVWTIGIALVLTVPLGLICAFYLNESRSRLSRLVRTVVEAMTALPDILFGLFVFATWILILHFQPSGLAAALALAMAMLPIIIRAADVVLRLVPGNLREAAAALGAPRWRVALNVVLPTSRSGLATAVILGAARGIGETAPVLLTAGYTLFFNDNPLHGPMVPLPLLAFTLVASGEHQMVTRGFGAAAVLLVLIVVLFSITRLIGGRGPGHVSRLRAQRIAAGSRRDLARIEGRARGYAGVRA